MKKVLVLAAVAAMAMGAKAGLTLTHSSISTRTYNNDIFINSETLNFDNAIPGVGGYEHIYFLTTSNYDKWNADGKASADTLTSYASFDISGTMRDNLNNKFLRTSIDISSDLFTGSGTISFSGGGVNSGFFGTQIHNAVADNLVALVTDDATGYFVPQVFADIEVSDMGDVRTVSFDLMRDESLGVLTSSDFTPFGSAESVPEPTSGLLLLLGVAGLALKRRRV